MALNAISIARLLKLHTKESGVPTYIRKTVIQYTLVLLIISVGVLVLNFKLLTNEATPGGDGGRIFPYIHFVDNSESFYPLWNPYKAGGVPTLADPERFVWLAKLVDSKSTFANLQFNLVFISVIVFVGFSVALLAIELDLSVVAAVLSSFVFISSWVFERWVITGRINALIAWALICLAIVCCIRWLKKGKIHYFFLLSVLCGKLIHDLGYYGLVMFGPFICLVYYYYAYRKYGKKQTLIIVPLQIVIMLVLGVLSYAIFLFPLVDYIATNLTTYNPLFTIADELPDPIGILNIFFPFYEIGLTKSFWFVSAVCFPLLFFFFVDKFNRKNVSIVILVILVLNIAVLFGKIYPFKFIVDIFVNNTFLSQIRQPSAFYFSVSLCLAILCGFGYDSITNFTNTVPLGFRKKYTHYLIVFFFINLLLFLVTDESTIKAVSEFYEDQHIFSNKFFNLYMIIALIAISTIPLMIFKTTIVIKVYIIALFLLQIFLFRIEFDNPKFRKNFSGLDTSIAKLLTDDNSYFRYWDRHPYFLYGILDLPNKMPLTGFSMYFSPEHRWWIENLIGNEIKELRPHWVKFKSVKDWNENFIKLSNLKYFIAPHSKNEQFGSNDNWIKITNGMQRLNLYQYAHWVSMLRVFDKWDVESDKGTISKKIINSTFDTKASLFLNKDPGIKTDDIGLELKYQIDIIKHTENEIVLLVKTNKNCIFYLPEYFDKYWQAYVDGKKIKVLRGNFAYRAIAILEGTHKVKLIYENPKFKWGFIISVVTLLIFTAISVIGFFRDTRKL